MIKPTNPFIISGYHSPEYFCDREEESRTIQEALANGRNVMLISPRRMGKTGLIQNIFYRINQECGSDTKTFYIDIFSTRNLGDFVRLLGNTVLGQLDSLPQEAMNRIGQFLKSCRPTLSFNELTGMPQVSLDIAPNREEATLKEIFDYLGSSGRRCVLSIDEFQQITEYPEQGVEALLRSHIQFLPNASFIFSGSKQHVMQEMFLSPKRPFYQSTQTVALNPIKRETYHRFAAAFFSEAGLTLDEEVFRSLYDRFEGHTWYVQCLLNRLYSYRQSPSEELIRQAITKIIAENEYAYQNLIAAYPAGAVRLLKAVAKEGVVPEINAGDFISAHRLKAASSVNAALKKLLNKEMIYKGDKGYSVYDRFLGLWLQQQEY